MQPELDKIGVVLLDASFQNFQPRAGYLASLEEKAQSQIQREISEQKTLQLDQQVLQEQKQTQVSMEIARRTNQVAQEENRVYDLSPQAYHLERLKRLKDVVGDKVKVYFIPEGTDLSIFLSGEQEPDLTPAQRAAVRPTPQPATVP